MDVGLSPVVKVLLGNLSSKLALPVPAIFSSLIAWVPDPDACKILAGDAVPMPMRPALTSAKNVDTPMFTSSANVENPVMFMFLPPISSYVMSPTTFKSPPTVTIPAIDTPPCG